ncbi:MAG: MBL fold metallo-hydrolase [Sporomusaceae bacterium]|nr:MBL fold metallo-hydrolase [Sporomusaceae bacterium]
MKVTVVVDNSVPISARHPFLAEHGLSLLIDTGSKKILLDTGQSAAVVHNLSLLGVHPRELDAVAISHGHYDHTGGLPHILRHRQKPIPVYAHPAIFGHRYSVAGGIRTHIGMPFVKEEAEACGAIWKLSEAPLEIDSGLWFSGAMPRQTAFELGDDRLIVPDACGCDCQDFIPDDTSLYYVSDKGLVVIGGCTHSGLVNTVYRGFELTGQKRLSGWVGGTHLGPVSKEQQKSTLDLLEEFAPDFIAASHCTGFDMMSALKTRFGPKFSTAFVGTVIDF